MSLDILTLYLVASLVAAMLGGLLLYFWRQERIEALGWWGAAYILGGVSIAAWTAAGAYLPGSIQVMLTMAGFLACGMVLNAARVFHGRESSWAPMLAGCVVWGAAG